MHMHTVGRQVWLKCWRSTRAGCPPRVRLKRPYLFLVLLSSDQRDKSGGSYDQQPFPKPTSNLKPQTSNLRTFKTKTTPRMSIKHLACRRTSHEKRGTARRRCGPEAARRAVAAPHRAAPARVSGVPPAPHPITLQDGTPCDHAPRATSW